MTTYTPYTDVFQYPDPDPLFDINRVLDPVANRAIAADQFSAELRNELTTAIADLRESATTIFDEGFFDSITDDPIFDISDAGIDGINPVAPPGVSIDSITITSPSSVIPALPVMDDLIDDIIGDVPAYNVEKPPINIPDLPADEFPVFTANEPTQTEIQFASKPEYTLPALPAINDVSIPSPLDYNIASFDGVMPVSDLTPPETMFVYNEAEYDSELANKLAEKLLYDITNGGSGLDTDTEQAIYDRAKSRQEEENEKAILAAQEFHSSRGFNLPNGALSAAIIEAYDRAGQRTEDLNNDILVQQSNLAQVNTHFVIQQAIGMEKNLMDNSNQVQSRAFEAAKAVVQMANEIYRIKVEAFIARLEGYKVQASVFETKIRAEIAKAEFYKAQIEGIKAGIEAKSLLISAYNAQIEGIKSLIQMYATEMEAAKIQADIDNSRLEAYKVKAQVFGIKTDAITSKYNAYQARIAGETEKIKMYLAENQAYTAKVEGFKAVASVESIKGEIKLAKHRGDIEGFKAAIERYSKESERLIAVAETQSKIEGLKIEKYKADTDKYRTDIDAIVRAYIGKIDKARAEADILIKEKEVTIQKILAEKGLTSDMILGQTKIGSQLVAAALTSISASASLGMTQSQGHTSSSGVSFSDNPGWHGTNSTTTMA